jgi:antibiotic biosynthesis monooxygenase (ABM) superfamily enzyme
VGDDEPVTTEVTRRIKPGHEAAYEAFLEGISAAARRSPGFVGVEVFRPPSAATGDYRIVYRFDSRRNLQRWLNSPVHAEWLARAEPHAAAPMQERFLTGLESWFTLPSQPGTPPPPPYKMALLTWVTIFPLITVIVIATAPLIGGLPVVPRLAITTLITVPVMTWVVMPRVTRLLRGWLHPRSRS